MNSSDMDSSDMASTTRGSNNRLRTRTSWRIAELQTRTAPQRCRRDDSIMRPSPEAQNYTKVFLPDDLRRFGPTRAICPPGIPPFRANVDGLCVGAVRRHAGD